MRQVDTVLLETRGGDVGSCGDYADLTTGLLRSLHLPARTVVTLARDKGTAKPVGHIWTEAFVGATAEPMWKQADSTWNKAIDDQSTYEAANWTVLEAWADQYPLSSASRSVNQPYRCVFDCYRPPIMCPLCQLMSITGEPRPIPDLSCVENVTSFYHAASSSSASIASATGALLTTLQAPTRVTRGLPFVISTSVTNDTLSPLSAITTIGLREYLDSTADLFDIAPSYQVLDNVAVGETITLTWTITPLVTGVGIPLRFSAESGDLFDISERPLVVNEAGTLSDLSLAGVCGLGNASPGQQVTLTANVLDENLQAFSDPATVVTATVVATPTLQFSTTFTLPYCEACGAYQGAFALPDSAPIGDYVVDFEAAHPSYDPAYATSGFFVVAPLTVSLSTNQNVVGVLDTIAMTAQVMDRGAAITGAAVTAEIVTPGGTVTVPLSFDSVSDTYRLTFHPAHLAGNLGGEVLASEWQVHAKADYQGGTDADSAAFTVVGTYPLSEAVISKVEAGAKLTWPHMGSGVDHYEVYRSTSPFFYPGAADSAKLSPDVAPAPTAGDGLSFTDTEAFAEPGTSYFYVVQPVDANGQLYPKSNRVGVFNFAVTPGTSP